MKIIYLWYIFYVLMFNACTETSNRDVYIDFTKFKEGRPCGEIKFHCLPESQDKHWQQMPTEDNLEELVLIEKNKQTYVKKGKKTMLISSLDKDFLHKVVKRQLIDEMEQSLAKEFPGFWKDTEKIVRYRWLNRAMSKSKKLGYGDGEITDNIQVIELCARLGLDFDLDPKWDYITKFVTMERGKTFGHAGAACEYLDFVIFNKDYAIGGDKITDWSMRDTLNYLPYPKRKIPSIND